MRLTSVYYFEGYDEAGVIDIPLNSLIMVKDGAEYNLFNLKTKVDLIETTTLRDLINTNQIEEKTGMPRGGGTGFVLTKQSNEDGDAVWVEPQETAGNFPINVEGDTFEPNFEKLNFFVYDLTGNTTIKKPINASLGQRGDFFIRQSSQGGNNVVWAPEFIFSSLLPADTAANSITHIQFRVLDSINIIMSVMGVYGANDNTEDGNVDLFDGNTDFIDALPIVTVGGGLFDGDSGTFVDGGVDKADGGVVSIV